MITRVIECKEWVHNETGQRASMFGAYPGDNYQLETVGYTWVSSSGTVGCGRRPAKTYEEAVEIMNRINNR
jgi:hypothetical protein